MNRIISVAAIPEKPDCEDSFLEGMADGESILDKVWRLVEECTCKRVPEPTARLSFAAIVYLMKQW
jgi:hypothetical protein